MHAEHSCGFAPVCANPAASFDRNRPPGARGKRCQHLPSHRRLLCGKLERSARGKPVGAGRWQKRSAPRIGHGRLYVGRRLRERPQFASAFRHPAPAVRGNGRTDRFLRPGAQPARRARNARVLRFAGQCAARGNRPQSRGKRFRPSGSGNFLPFPKERKRSRKAAFSRRVYHRAIARTGSVLSLAPRVCRLPSTGSHLVGRRLPKRRGPYRLPPAGKRPLVLRGLLGRR